MPIKDIGKALSFKEAINSELKTTSARIDELKGKDKLTLTEQAELDKLERQNKLLEQQSKIKQNVVNAKQKTAANDALKKLDFESEKGFETDRNGNYVAGPDGSPMMDSLTRTEKVKKDINSLKEEESLLNSINKQLSTGKNKSGKKLSKEDKKTLETDFKNTQNNIDEYKESISKMMDDINSDAANLYNKDTGLVLPDSKYQKKAKEIEKLNDTYLETIEGKSAKAAKAMDDIWEKNPKFAEAQQKMVDAFRSGKDLSVKDITKEFPDLVSACDKAGISVETLRDEIKALAEQDNGVTKLEGDFTKFQATAVSAINSMDVLNAAMANSFSGKGLSVELDKDTGELAGDITHVIDAYKGLDGYDPSVLFKKTANGVHLNREALRQLQAQQEANMKTDFINQQTSLQDRLNKALAEQKNYENGSKDYKNSEVVINDLENQLQTVQLLASAYDGATSAYQKWVDSKSNGEEGDMFRTVSDTMKKRGDQLYQEGRYNTNEFRAIADYFSYDDLSTAPVEKLVEAYQNATNARDAYFTGNKQGTDNFMADIQRVSEAEGKNWTKTTKDGLMEFNTGADEEIAKRFNLSKEAVQALFRAASEYNKVKLGDTSGVDTTTKSLEKMKEKAEDAKNKLKELSEASHNGLNFDFNFDSTDVADLDSQIERAKKNLEQFKNENGQVDLKIDGAQEAATILQTLIEQKQRVTQPAVMSIDTSGLDKDVADALGKVQEYQRAVNELNTLEQMQKLGIPVDTTQLDAAKTKVDETFAAIQKGSKDGTFKINADVSVNSSSKEALNADISAMTPEITAKIKPVMDGATPSVVSSTATSVTVNYTKGDQDPPTDKNAKVNYTKGLQYDAEDRNADVDYTRGDQQMPLSPVYSVVNYTLGDVPPVPEPTVKIHYDTSGIPKFDGTANAMGTTFGSACASGDWSVKKNETSLVGELGTEVIVRNGKFFTVGNNGAEFANIKSGDIVFNHKQTEELFKNGHVTSGGGRAKVVMGSGYTSGTAHSSGTWVFGNTGNGNIGGTGSTPSSWSSPAPPLDPAPIQKAAEAVQSEAKSTSDALKELTDNIDHVATKLNRLEHVTERAEKSIDRAVGIVNKENENSKALDAIKDEIAGNKKAYDTYISKAQEFASQSGLSEDLQSKIQTGAYEITHYDSDTKDKINEYKNW